MTDLRMLLMTEDYVGACLVMSDCDNEELTKILEQAEQNDEDGIGKTLTEICNELFPSNTLIELGCTEESDFADIRELDNVAVAYTNYLTFSAIQSKVV